MIKEIGFHTEKDDFFALTDLINSVIKESGVNEGVCHVYCPHTTASIVTTSRMDPNGFEDIKDDINRLIPTRIDFKHQVDTPTDASGHIKSAIIGTGSTFIIFKNELLLGSSQGIYFAEFDGPRNRKVFVHICKDQ